MECAQQQLRSSRTKRRYHRQGVWSSTYRDLNWIPPHWFLTDLEECLQLHNSYGKYIPEAPRAIQVRDGYAESGLHSLPPATFMLYGRLGISTFIISGKKSHNSNTCIFR